MGGSWDIAWPTKNVDLSKVWHLPLAPKATVIFLPLICKKGTTSLDEVPFLLLLQSLRFLAHLPSNPFCILCTLSKCAALSDNNSALVDCKMPPLRLFIECSQALALFSNLQLVLRDLLGPPFPFFQPLIGHIIPSKYRLCNFRFRSCSKAWFNFCHVCPGCSYMTASSQSSLRLSWIYSSLPCNFWFRFSIFLIFSSVHHRCLVNDW